MQRRKKDSAEQGSLLATSLLLSSALVTLLSDGELDTTATGHRDHGLALGANDENVAETGGEVTAKDIADVDNVEATEVTLLTGDDTGTALVTTTSDHDGGTSVKGNKVEDLLRLNVESDSVVDLDGRVGVSDGAAVVGDNVGNATGTELHLLDLEELVGGLLGGDAVNDEAALNVVEDTEVLARLLDRNNVLETSGVGGVGADLAVDLDETLGSDGVNLTAGESVLQSVAEEDLRRRQGRKGEVSLRDSARPEVIFPSTGASRKACPACIVERADVVPAYFLLVQRWSPTLTLSRESLLVDAFPDSRAYRPLQSCVPARRLLGPDATSV